MMRLSVLQGANEHLAADAIRTPRAILFQEATDQRLERREELL
jgi:hypothetical protein